MSLLNQKFLRLNYFEKSGDTDGLRDGQCATLNAAPTWRAA